MMENTYPRRIEPLLKKYLSSREIIVITGMRRVGKTTLIQRLFDQLETENKLFIDLENRVNRWIFQENDYENTLRELMDRGLSKNQTGYVFLDEIQFVPEVISIVKYLHDHYKLKFILTGSSSFYMKNQFQESLAGRKFLFRLRPLDFGEFLLFKEIEDTFADNKLQQLAASKSKVQHERKKNLFVEFQRYGGFPGVVRAEEPDRKRRLLEDIFSSYIEMDVSSLSNFRKIDVMEKLCLLLMKRAGSKLDVNKLASQLEVSRNTIYNYLQFLEDTFFLQRIQPFSRSVDREVSGHPKLYLADPGLLCQLGDQAPGGSVLENTVFNQLHLYGEKTNYYERRSGGELDFVLDQKIGLEVKETVTKSEVRQCSQIAKDLELEQSFVVSHNYHEDPRVILSQQLGS